MANYPDDPDDLGNYEVDGEICEKLVTEINERLADLSILRRKIDLKEQFYLRCLEKAVRWVTMSKS
jgi:hypothetical protein